MIVILLLQRAKDTFIHKHFIFKPHTNNNSFVEDGAICYHTFKAQGGGGAPGGLMAGKTFCPMIFFLVTPFYPSQLTGL